MFCFLNTILKSNKNVIFLTSRRTITKKTFILPSVENNNNVYTNSIDDDCEYTRHAYAIMYEREQLNKKPLEIYDDTIDDYDYEYVDEDGNYQYK